MEDTHTYRAARHHVERKIGFYIHLAVFLTVNAGLLLINFVLVPGRIWAFWPLAGWGIGLLFHRLAVLLHAPGTHWKQRMIDNELRKIKK